MSMKSFDVCFSFEFNDVNMAELFRLVIPTIGFNIEWFSAHNLAPKGDFYNEDTITDIINVDCNYFRLQETTPGIQGQSFSFQKQLQFNVYTLFWTMNNVDFLTESFINSLTQNRVLIFGCIFNGDDAFWQSATELNAFKQMKKSTWGLKLVKSKLFYNEMEVDISKNYGRIATVRDMLLIAAPYMWFGPGYYKYVPKELLKSFNAAEKIEEIGNNNLFIKLFEYKLDPGKSKLRAIQGQFRKWIDMDELEIRLRK